MNRAPRWPMYQLSGDSWMQISWNSTATPGTKYQDEGRDHNRLYQES